MRGEKHRFARRQGYRCHKCHRRFTKREGMRLYRYEGKNHLTCKACLEVLHVQAPFAIWAQRLSEDKA